MMGESDQRPLKILDEEIIPNIKEIDTTKIIWQNDDGNSEDFCSLNSCKQPIGDEKALFLRESKTSLIAFFHPSCFREIRK
jgi:hypothetical protein